MGKYLMMMFLIQELIMQSRLLLMAKRRFAFGWIASKYGNTDFGPWEWGGTMNFHEIIQNSKNGELRIKAIPEVLDYFSKEIELKKNFI